MRRGRARRRSPHRGSGGGARLARALALAATVIAVTALGVDLAVDGEALRSSGPRPVAALLGFVGERRPALVVFAADPGVLHRFRRPTRCHHRRFIVALAAHTECLIWAAEELGADAS